MARSRFVPAHFAIPPPPERVGFAFVPVRFDHDEHLLVAWANNAECFPCAQGFGDGGSPTDQMSRDDRVLRLREYQQDFEDRRGFTYFVIPEDGDEITGCVSIYPSTKEGFDADIRSSVIASRADLDPLLYESVLQWVDQAWPFHTFDYSPRGKALRAGGAPVTTDTGTPSTSRTSGRHIVTGAIWGNLSVIIPTVISIGLTPYLILGFGVRRWGLYVLLSAVSVLLSPIGGGVGPAVSRYFSLYSAREDDKRVSQTFFTAFLFVLAVGVGGSVLSWIVAPDVMHLLRVHGGLQTEGIFMLRTLGLLVALTLIHNLYVSLINATQAYALTNITTALSYFVWAGGMVLSVQHHWGLRGAALALLGQQVFSSVLIAPRCLRFLSLSRPLLLKRSEAKELLSFAVSTEAMSFVVLLNAQFNSLIVGAVFNLPDLAYFDTGANFATQLRGLATAALGPAGIHMARVFGVEGDDGAVSDFKRLQRAWVIGVSGWSSVGLAASYFGVVAWLGSRFSLGGEVAVLFMGGNMVNLWTGMLTQYLAAVGKPTLEPRYVVFSVVINLVVTLPLIFLGPLGVAGATMLGTVIASFYLLRIVRRRYRPDVPSFLKEIPVLASLCAGIVTVALELPIMSLRIHGAAGLVLCGFPALIGLGCFSLLVLRKNLGGLYRSLRAREFSVGLVVQTLIGNEEQIPARG